MDVVTWLKGSMVSAGAEWVMWLMFALSAVSVAIIVERWWLFRSLRDDLGKLARDLGASLDISLEHARQRMSQSPSAEAAVVLAGLRMAERGPEAVEQAVAGAAALQRNRLERRLAYLATLGNNAPFIGLFGTVIGIVGAFDALDQASQAGVMEAASQLVAPQAVMASIGEALVATAVGIGIAIPAVAANNYFQRTTRTIIANTEALTRVLLANMMGHAPVRGDEPTIIEHDATIPTPQPQEA